MRIGADTRRVTPAPQAPPADAVSGSTPPTGPPRRDDGPAGTADAVALVDVGPATKSLLSVWLGELRWTVADLDAPARRPRLIVVEVSFPRTDPRSGLPWLGRSFPGVPIILISPTIVAGTPSRGDVARHLGVAAVLAMPLSRDALLATVRELTTSAP